MARKTESVKLSKVTVDAARKEAKELGCFIGTIFERALAIYFVEKIAIQARGKRQ